MAMNNISEIIPQNELEPVIAAFNDLWEAVKTGITAICDLANVLCKFIWEAVKLISDYIFELYFTQREAYIFRHTKKRRIRKKYRNRALRRIIAEAEGGL